MARYPLARLVSQQEEAKPVTEVNIIPVIDISLVLLVILFVTAPLLSVPNTAVSLPPAGQPSEGDAFIAVTYALDGSMSLMSQPTDWANLPRELSGEIKRRPAAPVVLRVDKGVRYGTVQKLIAAAKEAGASQIALGGRPKRPVPRKRGGPDSRRRDPT